MEIGVRVARFAVAAYDVPGQAAWRVRLGGRYVLTTGGLAPDNGTLDLLEAHATLVLEQAALADVRLVVVGDGDADEHLVELSTRASELGTAPIVVEAVADAELPSLVAGAAAFCYLPTHDASCAGALEALAAGVPVIARDLPEVRAVLQDVVEYGDTVLSIADALLDVLTDPPDPEPGAVLAAAHAGPRLEDGVVEQQPDRGDGREE